MTIAVRATQFDRYAFITDYNLLLWSDEMKEKYDAFDQQDWVAEFVGDDEPSEAMQIGTAFHAMMEQLAKRAPTYAEYRDNLFITEGHEIKDRTIAFRWLCSPPEIPIYGADTEVFHARRASTGDVLITGHCDAITSHRVIEYKTSSKRADIARHFRSWQWRVYLYLTGLDEFTYHCFQVLPMRATKALRQEPWYTSDLFFVNVKMHEALPLHRYPTLDAEVEACAIEVADWMEHSGIAQHTDHETTLRTAAEGSR